MRKLFVIALLLILATSSLAQVPRLTGMHKPAPSYSLYQTLIGFGDSREIGKVRIWSHDQQTVYIQIVVKKTVIRFVANDQGLQEVWSCALKDRRFAKTPVRIIFTDFGNELSSDGNQWQTIEGGNSMMVKIVRLPRRSKSSQDFNKAFQRLVERYELKEG